MEPLSLTTEIQNQALIPICCEANQNMRKQILWKYRITQARIKRIKGKREKRDTRVTLVQPKMAYIQQWWSSFRIESRLQVTRFALQEKHPSLKHNLPLRPVSLS